jgi:hypothetical protein
MFEGTLVFIEIKEQLRLFLYMRETVVDEDVASGAMIFRVPRPLISGVRSYMGGMTLVKLWAHYLVWCRASCPLNPGHSRDKRGCWYRLVSGSDSRVG